MTSLIALVQMVFLFSLGMLFYTYAGYPLVMMLLRCVYALPVRKGNILPRVSLVIAAHNEENDIAAKLDNALQLDYPPEKLEIVVASDCSTDRTDEIVQSYMARGVLLYRQEHHFGKTIAQNAAVKLTSGEILLFSDATTIYQPNVVRKLVRAFADPSVGCVAGQLIYVDDKASVVGDGCKSYWNYEKLLKQCESEVCSLIGVSGCLYAVRRSCHQKLANDMIDDFVIASEIRMQGLRTVYEPEAISMEDTNRRGRDEFRMRVRVIQQTLNALHRYRAVLDLPKHGLYAFQMISHKLLRYLAPVFLLGALATNAVNALLVTRHNYYSLLLAGQLAFYGLALLGWLGQRLGLKLGLLSLPYYFVLANAAVVVAFFKFMRGETRAVWQSVRENKPQTEPDTDIRVVV
jgi:cellulose synthase/poly-beta-1,6-N-acetylglucosamine synthase-like glycosyltransferase